MSEQIIGHDCDGKPIPAGAVVVATSDPLVVKTEHRGTQFRVLSQADETRQLLSQLRRGPGTLLLCDDGMYIRDCSVRLVKDNSKDDEQHRTDHTPADEDFQADLQQWLAGSKQRSKA